MDRDRPGPHLLRLAIRRRHPLAAGPGACRLDPQTGDMTQILVEGEFIGEAASALDAMVREGICPSKK